MMSMAPDRRGWAVVGLLASILATACTGLKVRTDFDREIDFVAYRTFDWLAPPRVERSEGAIDPFAYNSLLDKRIRRAVEQELGSLGYRKSNSGSADLRLNYHVILKKELVASATSFGHLHHHGHGGALGGFGVDVRQFQKGTIIIDLLDPELDQLVWRGWAVGRNRDGNYDDREVRRAVHEILRRFPPGSEPG
jgi:hypothetical protein